MNQRTYLIVIAVLVFVIFSQRSCTSSPQTPEPPQVVYDTSWNTITLTETKRVPFIVRDTAFLPGDSVFIPDLDYDKLKLQYQSLALDYRARNIYRDSLLVDSFGYIIIMDTLQYNKLALRTYKHSYSIPTIIGYVQPKQKRQVYVGGGLSVDQDITLANLQMNLLYKNKKDQIFGVHTGISQNLKPYFGGSMYWKIKLKQQN